MSQRSYHLFPPLAGNSIRRCEYLFLFETSRCDAENFTSYLFYNPIDVIIVHRPSQIKNAFKKIESYARRHYLAGYCTYELGYHFDRVLSRPPHFSRPLIHLAVFDRCTTFNHRTGRVCGASAQMFASSPLYHHAAIRNVRMNLGRRRYADTIRCIKEHIRAGDTYQVNFTGSCRFDLDGDPYAFYELLKKRQPVAYGAFCKCKDEYIISLSPELFFRRDGARIYSRPMKGTSPRGCNAQLRTSKKNRAENIMIVDMVRNDIGRIAVTGSVNAPKLFTIEPYASLLQMTSTVTGILRRGTTYYDIFRSIFPGGSVTGAPKIRTMQIIRELEQMPRGIYCGALGMIRPRGRAVFNLPIRTVVLHSGVGQMGVGSGIVYDSDAHDEFNECLLKARFLTSATAPFQLLETIGWHDGYTFVREHLARMARSARYFGMPFSASRIRHALQAAARRFTPGMAYRVRVLLAESGAVSCESTPITAAPSAVLPIVTFSHYRTDPGNVFYYHKTTNRALYDSEHRAYAARGFFDVLFTNTRDEVTEGAISNIIIQQGNRYYTPPVSSGILPGIYRASFLRTHRVFERVLSREDLLHSGRVFVCNSVRGLVEVKIVPGRKDSMLQYPQRKVQACPTN